MSLRGQLWPFPLHLAPALERNNNLQRLRLLDCLLGMEGTHALAVALAHHPALVSLELKGCSIGDGADALGVLLGRNARITHLGLERCPDGLGAGGLQLIVAAFESRTLTSLSLAGNAIDVDGAHLLGEALRTNRRLASIRLEACSLGDAGVHEIASGLEENDTLTKLHLDWNGLTAESARALKTALECNTALQSLCLQQPWSWAAWLCDARWRSG
jgi:Ran GTPase-activating protein (RanGAP) involved in mRNA processing and transport